MFLKYLHWYVITYHDYPGPPTALPEEIETLEEGAEESWKNAEEKRGIGFKSACVLQRIVFVVDITCPECDRTSPVQKVSLGEYRCIECDVEFSHHDVR